MNKTYVKKQIGVLEEMVSNLETLRENLQEKYDNMSETRQESEKGEALYAQIDEVQSTIYNLENAYAAIQQIYPEE